MRKRDRSPRHPHVFNSAGNAGATTWSIRAKPRVHAPKQGSHLHSVSQDHSRGWTTDWSREEKGISTPEGGLGSN